MSENDDYVDRDPDPRQPLSPVWLAVISMAIILLTILVVRLLFIHVLDLRE